MSGVNKVFLVGRLGCDPQIQTIQNAKSICTFSFATSEKVGGIEKTLWHKIIAWEKTAEVSQNYLSKGKLAHIEGKIQYREYESKDGAKRSVTEIICQNLTLIDLPNKQSINEKQRNDDDVPF